MLTQRKADDNLHFLILEVHQQVERTRAYLNQPQRDLLERIIARDDYIDNLKTTIQRKCFDSAADSAAEDGRSLEFLKSVEVIAVNLERIADFCEKIIRQFSYLKHSKALSLSNLEPYCDEVLGGLSLVSEAVFDHNADVAEKICRAEPHLDELYNETLREILEKLKISDDPQSLVTSLFIAHYFERMGDSLLNIGEAVISACLGERFKIGQFKTVMDSLEAVEPSASVDELMIEAMAETRSGARIDRIVSTNGDGAEQTVVLKQGRAAKLIEEKNCLDRWNDTIPGLAPKICYFNPEGERAALLYEYLPGRTIEELILKGNDRIVNTALERLCDTTASVWDQTRSNKPVSAEFPAQILKRLPDVYTAHPEFHHANGANGLAVPSFDTMVENSKIMSAALKAPFSVLVHGDFNVDNIIYDIKSDRIHFIDLHRSRMTDYAQDVSVFLVSNYRLPHFDHATRVRIQRVILGFYDFACDYAEQVGDRGFRARLALGLARSYATSTRFVRDRYFANKLFGKSRELMASLVAADTAGLQTFQVPRSVLVD